MVLLGAILGISFLLCNRCQIKTSNSTLMFKYFLLCIRLVVTTLLSPLENLWLHENPEFLYLAPVFQVGSTLTGYILDVYQMRKYRRDRVINFKMWAFSLFSSTQGLFYDTFMYSLSCKEFNSGVEDSLQAFCVTEHPENEWKLVLYLGVFLVFGVVLYYNAISWNMECSEEEMKTRLNQIFVQLFCYFTSFVLILVLISISSPEIEFRFPDKVWLAVYVLAVHLISTLLLVYIHIVFKYILFILLAILVFTPLLLILYITEND